MRKLLYIAQPDRSRCCGQAVAAMVLRISLEDCAELFATVLGISGKGYTYGTTAGYLSKVLASRGVACSRLIPYRGKLPQRGVLRLTSIEPSSWGHWALAWDGRIYDPAYGIDPHYPPHIKIVSYLNLK